MKAMPDFLRPTRRPHRLAWASCGTALLVLGVAALEARDAAEALAQAERAATRPLEPVPPGAPPAPPADPAAQRALDEALRRLERPWPASFHGIENIQARGLAWLSLRIDERGTLHLEGRAPDTVTALAAAQLLRRQPGWHDVVLGRMESTPEGVQAFEISAAWTEARP